MNSVREVLERAVQQNSESPYLWFEGDTITFGEMFKEIAKVANGFRKLGIQKGDRVAFMLPNIPETLYIWLGLNSIGVSIVPINTFFKEKETTYLINHSEAKFIVTHKDYYSMIRSIVPDCPKIQQLIVIDADGDLEKGITYEELIHNQSETLPQVTINIKDEASILYTSGTTGQPKGCILSQSYYLISGKRFSQHLNLTEKDCVITPLPFFHMNPQVLSGMGTLFSGARLAIVDRFHPKSWWDTVRQSGATVFHYQGVMPAMLMGLEPTEQDANHPHWIGMGAGVPKSLHKAFEERFNVTLLEGFGMTECGLNFLARVEGDRKAGTACFGKVFPEFEAKVFDDNDQEVNIGEVGELVLRSSDVNNRRLGFMSEYYKDSLATKTVWSSGWFHTGDYVRNDEEGNFYFVDRKKDIIRRSGENISASEVEDVIRKHPSVLDVAVVAVPDPIREQEVKAFVIPAEGKSLDLTEIINHCEENLAYYKIPRYWKIRESFPLTKTGKIQKQVLRTESELENDCFDRKNVYH